MAGLDALTTWPVGRAAAAVGAPGVLLASTGDDTAPFAWASLTKLCTALAVLVAVEEGTVALDDPAGPPGSTVAHLLAHASGLAPAERRVLAPAGTRRIYSNAGFEVLADAVAARSGMGFDLYLRQAVFEPLAMHGTRLGPTESPATAMVGTLRDLCALAQELLMPRLVHPTTLARAVSVAFPGLAGVVPGFGAFDPCDWGLGFELRDAKSPHWTGGANSPGTFGHFGASGCFLWVDPLAGLALAVLTDTPFAGWAATAWPALSDAVLGDYRA